MFKSRQVHLGILLCLLILSSCSEENKKPIFGGIQLAIVRVGTNALDLIDFTKNKNTPLDKPVVATFSVALNKDAVARAIQLKHIATGAIVPITIQYLDEDKTISVQPIQNLLPLEVYDFIISNELSGVQKETFQGYHIEFSTGAEVLSITSLKIASAEVITSNLIQNVPIENTTINITFDKVINPDFVSSSYFLVSHQGIAVPLIFSLSNENKTVTITLNQKLKDLQKYLFTISDEVQGANKEIFQSFSKKFYTTVDPTPDFPIITGDELLTLVQQQTFKYFYDFAHPASGMARERNTSGNLVTSGGSGFGIMAMIVAMERNFITRPQGLERMNKILNFLETADRFHGAWAHWMDGNTGKVIPFSPNDNGGDLVETSFLVQGLITFRQYLNPLVAEEANLIDRINVLCKAVEWNWYRQNNQNVLYWHWSPDKNWTMNLPIRGWNECLITYVLAASANPDKSIPKTVYTSGWAGGGNMINGNNFEGITLPLGYGYGGPLFFSQYSFLGLDPRALTDQYANYWTQNTSHSLINYKYCVRNPKKFVAYSEECWGLTSSDNQSGYSAHSPTNDLGVITPTAALSSFPYTPNESMTALKFFYYTLGDKLWGPYGFYDAFNVTEGWTASSYLAIDQGPIIIMIENQRTGLLWNLFMSATEVKNGLDVLGIVTN
ncbi:MAG: glucoamylase family protein [Bacteroidota bacterium]|nr:glucoamylase family protein [Bacteroidota bacterium]